jgi:hypothetical protein
MRGAGRVLRDVTRFMKALVLTKLANYNFLVKELIDGIISKSIHFLFF